MERVAERERPFKLQANNPVGFNAVEVNYTIPCTTYYVCRLDLNL